MGKRRLQREKESSVRGTVGEASSLLESQMARRRRGRPRKNLESPENFKKEEDEDYEEYEDEEEEEEDEQVEIVNREKLKKKKKKVRSSPSVEEGQKWKLEEVAKPEEEEKPDMTVKTVAPLSYRRSRRKNTPVKSW
ncbi:hypothetical protein DY000_02063941 [Brassica cretica]|uniref:Uncharacterized protein n=1 Tax=Brassica cretica TaxID=69181 RepID=A0ABQ7AMU3_BRACR|nr:hypothetical protein DY000_02063941 [Brassica cretica]